MSAPRAWALTEGQRRCLTTGLRQIEQALALIGALSVGPTQVALDAFTDDLDEPTCDRLGHTLGEARILIDELRVGLGLEREALSKRRWIAGQLPRLWVMAEECQTRFLRGYGPVAPELHEQLDPKLRRLTAMLVDMFQLVSGQSVASPPGSQA